MAKAVKSIVKFFKEHSPKNHPIGYGIATIVIAGGAGGVTYLCYTYGTATVMSTVGLPTGYSLVEAHKFGETAYKFLTNIDNAFFVAAKKTGDYFKDNRKRHFGDLLAGFFRKVGQHIADGVKKLFEKMTGTSDQAETKEKPEKTEEPLRPHFSNAGSRPQPNRPRSKQPRPKRDPNRQANWDRSQRSRAAAKKAA